MNNNISSELMEIKRLIGNSTQANEERMIISDMSLSDIKAQLDRIEKAVQKATLSNIRLWVLSVAIALILATPTVIGTNLTLAMTMFLFGTVLIFLAASFKKK